ncbi:MULTISPECIES: hypothetical protein [unclassified Paenibacillus]|uniref:hypothetical protein n=1 Tax=unclassified Paenibacillus TaxID=185978 RepID=UPI00110F84EC|nr:MULTISPECIES: hypothetical protein [unclassified Paenibacillus]
MKSRLLVISAMVLNVIFMLFALYGQSYMQYAPTIGWVGESLSCGVAFSPYKMLILSTSLCPVLNTKRAAQRSSLANRRLVAARCFLSPCPQSCQPQRTTEDAFR